MRRGQRALRHREDQPVRRRGLRSGRPEFSVALVRVGTVLAVLSLSVVFATGCVVHRPWFPPPVQGGGGGGSADCGGSQPPSTYAGATLTVDQALQYAYEAGFRTVTELQAVVGIGEAESSLTTQARRWHPEYGCRPASDVIGVQGPASVWNSNHTLQMHSDRGTWQISSHFWPQYSDAQTDDPAQAAKAVWEISNHGTNFGLWDTYPSPALSDAPSTNTVEAFLATR